LAPYVELHARIDRALEGLSSLPRQHTAEADRAHQQALPGRDALDAVFGKSSSRGTLIEKPPAAAVSNHPEIWIDHTVRSKAGIASGIYYFEFPAVPVVLEVRISRDYSVRPGRPTKFNVWRHARFASWDDLCELANFRREAYKNLLGWKSCVSLECDERHVEAQALFDAKAWMLSAMRREIEVGGDNLSTKEYKEALSLRNAYDAQIARAEAELKLIRLRISELRKT